MISFFFSDPASGTGCAIVGDSPDAARALIVGGGSDAVAAPADVSISDGELRARIDAGPLTLELTATALYPPLVLDEPGLTASAHRVRAKLAAEGNEKLIDGAGELTRSDDPTWSGEGRRRHVCAVLDDGSLLIAAAAGAPGAEHGTESVAAWLVDPDGGASRFAEPLVSTQYDGEGHVTRVGLELWPEQADAPPVRAAALPIAGPSRPVDGDGLELALLEWSVDGRHGTGSYAFWKG